MAILAGLSIATIPSTLELFERIFGWPFTIGPRVIAGVVVKAELAPLTAGMVVRAVVPRVAERMEGPLALVVKVLLPLAILVLLGGTLSAIWALVGNGTALAMLIFILAGLAVGHVLGGPDPDHSVVLALSTACRHPGIALAIASTNFPGQRFGATILLYLIVNAAVAVPYILWHRRHVAGAVPTA
jgi:BASS family bile acid:Na+ symporter